MSPAVTTEAVVAYQSLVKFLIKPACIIKEIAEHFYSVEYSYNSKETKFRILIKYEAITIDEALDKVIIDLLKIAPHIGELMG